MKIISIILLSILISSCDYNSSVTNNAKQSAEDSNKRFEEHMEKVREENVRMDRLAKIVSSEIKTSSTFQEYFVIVVQNFSNQKISDLQIVCVSNSGDNGVIDLTENVFPASVNLGPGENATITTMPVLHPFKIFIKKIRFENGTVASRDTSR
jgi:hypothetical protein